MMMKTMDFDFQSLLCQLLTLGKLYNLSGPQFLLSKKGHLTPQACNRDDYVKNAQKSTWHKVNIQKWNILLVHIWPHKLLIYACDNL